MVFTGDGTFKSPFNEEIAAEALELDKIATILASGNTADLVTVQRSVDIISVRGSSLAAGAAKGTLDQQYLCDGIQMIGTAECELLRWITNGNVRTPIPIALETWLKNASRIGLFLTSNNYTYLSDSQKQEIKDSVLILNSDALKIAAKYGGKEYAKLCEAIMAINSCFSYYIGYVSPDPQSLGGKTLNL
jgi:hypothetical protein